MMIKEELNKKNDAVRNAFLHGSKEDLEKSGADLMDSLVSAIETGKAEEADSDSIRSAIWECIGRYSPLDNEMIEANTDAIVSRVINLVNDRSIDKTTKMIWIRSLIRALHRTDVEKMEKNTTVSYFNRFYLPAMEQEADENPSPELMKWYEVFLEKDPGYKVESSMYNRLAYYWLHGYCRPQEYRDRAEAYFKAMERRGIKAENPYKGHYGESDHEELIRALFAGDFDIRERMHWKEMAEGISRKMAAGTAEDPDLIEFREVMYKMNLNNMYGENGFDKELWDQTIMECGDALTECIAKADQSEKCVEAARTIIIALTEYDNWLLRYMEMTNEGATADESYTVVEQWLDKLEPIADETTWVMMSSLRGILIDGYYKTYETEKLIKLLEEQTKSDVAAYLTGETYNKSGKRYCTNNTMALIKLLIEKGERDEAESIIREISDNAHDVEAAMLFGGGDKIASLWLKYINLLETYGYESEAAEWKVRLQNEYDKSSSEIECELSYLKGNYEKALSFCGGSEERSYKETIEMLEYIMHGKLPADTNEDNVVIHDLKSPEAVHCRGSVTTDELQREIEMSNEEWHRCSARMSELVRIFEAGLREGGQSVVYPADYYKISCEYAPDIPIMRGDYIRYLYKGGDGRKWLGLTREDARHIENELKKNN